MADKQPVEAGQATGLWGKIRGWLGRAGARAGEGPTAPRGVAAGVEGTAIPTGNPLLAKEGYVGNFALNAESSFDANSPMAHALQLSDDLLQRYRDVEDMDDYPETSAILTLYADDATIPDSQSGRTIWASSNDKLVRDVLEDLLLRRLRIEDEVHGLARTIGKYGNRFGEVLVGTAGVVGINYLGAPTVRRVQDLHGVTLGFVQDPTGQFKITQDEFVQALQVPRDQRRPVADCVVFEPWEIAHWRLRTKDQTAVYGVSVLDGARWAWKRLTMLEDTALVTKMTRGPSRLAFYIDTGELPPAESLAHVNKIKQQYSRKKVFNPSTGQIDFRYNVQCLTGDTKIRTLDGTEKTLLEMEAAHKRGEDQWVYSVDLARNGKFVPGKVSWAGKTRENAELVKVTLDNGEAIRLTPDHKCIRRNGDAVLAGDLQPGDSLMPLRIKAFDHVWNHPRGKYEHVYDPDTRKYVLTHQVVARECGMLGEGQIIHHENGRGDNRPASLRCITQTEHMRIHCERGEAGGHVVARMRKVDPELDRRIREGASRALKALHKDPGFRDRHSKRVSARNISSDSGKYLRAYNSSPKHTEDNAIRSKAARSYWANEENKDRIRTLRTLVYPDSFMDSVRRFVFENKDATAEDVARFVMSTPRLLEELNAHSFKPVKNVCHASMLRAYRQHGFENFREFKNSAIEHNHKVIAVERLVEREDTYTLTVESVHTFGLSAGIYVHNSNLEDIWLGSRGGKDSTRIDVLQGVDNQDLDILEYFRNKVLAAALVPKRILGMEENQARVASGDDVRFARAAMRLQREVKNGLKQVCRIHLAALGIDPDQVKFDLHMTVPSYIFELAQLEVRMQQAQLAQGLGELVPPPWILQHVFGFSQDEAIYVTDAARADQATQAKAQAATQADIMRAYPEVAGMPPVGAAGEEELPPEEEEAATEAVGPRGADAAVRRRLDRLLAESARVTRLTERVATQVAGIDRAVGQQAKDAARGRRAAGGYKRG